ncbi:MAG TPA: hypothetical protein VGJ87_05790 [Roseiflexaceae bacterium]|jgi:hypothetical protein
MPNFVLLYNGGSMPASEAEQAAVLQAWGAWYERLGSAVVDGGNPFTPVAQSIASDGSVRDGPVGTMASGYSIITADSLDAAVEKAKGCPVLQGGGQISVYETLNVM